MEKLYVALALIGIFLLGLAVIMKELLSLKSRIDFTNEFNANLLKYYKSRGDDIATYTWLIKKSNAMQIQMGASGIMAEYQPAYRNVVYSNYQIILNMIPDLDRVIKEGILQDQAQQYAKTIHESLLRHSGVLEELIEEKQKEIRNPIVWLREGTRFLLSFPIRMLTWLGILSEGITYKLYSNFIVTKISGIIAFIGLFSGVLSIIVGWEEFIKISSEYYNSIKTQVIDLLNKNT